MYMKGEAHTENPDGTKLSPAEALRLACSQGEHRGPTCGLAGGYAQANLVILPREHASDFEEFCRKNPKPCPLLERVDGPISQTLAPGADLRTCLPKYRVYLEGRLTAEVGDAAAFWEEGMVCFLLGCSFSFEEALDRAGLPLRHVEEGKNVPMFQTDRDCHPVGVFQGPLVASMRPMAEDQARRAAKVTRRYPRVHGSPVHIGSPVSIGIKDISKPQFGDAVTVHPGEVPVFWACGVTPQAVVTRSGVPMCITHAPGHMLVCDVLNEELACSAEPGS